MFNLISLQKIDSILVLLYYFTILMLLFFSVNLYDERIVLQFFSNVSCHIIHFIIYLFYYKFVCDSKWKILKILFPGAEILPFQFPTQKFHFHESTSCFN